MISMCADAIIKAESAARKRELEEAAGTWEGKLLNLHRSSFSIMGNFVLDTRTLSLDNKTL